MYVTFDPHNFADQQKAELAMNFNLLHNRDRYCYQKVCSLFKKIHSPFHSPLHHSSSFPVQQLETPNSKVRRGYINTPTHLSDLEQV